MNWKRELKNEEVLSKTQSLALKELKIIEAVHKEYDRQKKLKQPVSKVMKDLFLTAKDLLIVYAKNMNEKENGQISKTINSKQKEIWDSILNIPKNK